MVCGSERQVIEIKKALSFLSAFSVNDIYYYGKSDTNLSRKKFAES